MDSEPKGSRDRDGVPAPKPDLRPFFAPSFGPSDFPLASSPGLTSQPPRKGSRHGKVIPFMPRLIKRPPGAARLPHGIVRDTLGLSVSLGRIGSLEVRLAVTKKEIRKAQRLRFKVFYEELSATPNPTAMVTRRDKDQFDYVCDHLLVIDHEPPPEPAGKFKGMPFRRSRKPKVVGTYRLLRQDVADRNFGFYTASEYEIAGIIAANSGLRFLELGRSCVLKPYRNKRTVELLWHGIWAYVVHHKIDVMLGCASLEGTDPNKLAMPLAFLHHFASAPEGWRARAVPSRRVPMDRLPKDQINPKSALQALPPLIKGYLRVGATFGDGAVIDKQFGTTDVFVLVKVADIDRRYINYYGSETGRHAA